MLFISYYKLALFLKSTVLTNFMSLRSFLMRQWYYYELFQFLLRGSLLCYLPSCEKST